MGSQLLKRVLPQFIKDYVHPRAMSAQWIKHVKKNSSNIDLLNAEQKKQIDAIWSPFWKKHGFTKSYIFHSFYYEKTGIFDPRFVPDNLHYAFIDRYYSDHNAAKYLDNKCLYPRLFPQIKQPEVIACRMGGSWLWGGNELIPESEIYGRLASYKEFFVKEAAESCGGHGVALFSGEGANEECKAFLLNTGGGDVVIQKRIEQHSVIASLNPTSVNTIRILSLLRNGEVKIYSRVLRMGVNGAYVDNASSGGITCGIQPNGQLNATGYFADGRKSDVHPTSGVRFSEIIVPGIVRACELIKKLHVIVPQFQLISWDVAIDQKEEPILIEMNASYGELDFHQLNNGPLFGNDTEEIIAEVLLGEKGTITYL